MSFSKSSEELYAQKSKLFSQFILNNVNTIVLVGSGCNGKSYLTNEFSKLLNISNYKIMNSDESYIWDDDEMFNKVFKENKQKMIVHLLSLDDNIYKSVLEHNSKSIGIIDMNEIKF